MTTKMNKGLIGITLAFIMVASIFAAIAPSTTAEVESQGLLTQGKSGPSVVPGIVGYSVPFEIFVANPVQNASAGDWTGDVYEVPPGFDENDRQNKVGWIKLTATPITLSQGGPLQSYGYDYALTQADVDAGGVLNKMAALGKHEDGTWTNGTGQHFVSIVPLTPPEFEFEWEAIGCLEVEFDPSYTAEGTTIVNHTWTFGDGTTAGPIAGPPVAITHTYATCGVKSVTLSGWADNGLSGAFTDLIYVDCGPTAVAKRSPSCFDAGGT
ncbi:MAG TPA: hypothetical protein ENN68_08140, partial [Methanomicrobia archaeon]|nr:hypothetical protein [Methanomicrobia archaeon]